MLKRATVSCSFDVLACFVAVDMLSDAVIKLPREAYVTDNNTDVGPWSVRRGILPGG